MEKNRGAVTMREIIKEKGLAVKKDQRGTIGIIIGNPEVDLEKEAMKNGVRRKLKLRMLWSSIDREAGIDIKMSMKRRINIVRKEKIMIEKGGNIMMLIDQEMIVM